MSTHLEELPIEMLAHVALFLDRHRWHSHPFEDNGLLALRCVSRAGLDAVRRAIKNHPTNDVIFFSASDARQITTVGKVLGSGCQRLEYQGTANKLSPDKLHALGQFIAVENRGRLRELSLNGSPISSQLFLEICRACPLLKELRAAWELPNIASADVDDFAAALSRSCPLLESVEIQTNALLSPAETYAMHFPNLKFLNLEVEDAEVGYAPSRLDKIEAAARLCVGAEELGLSRCTVSEALAERLIRTPLHSRIKSLYLTEAIISSQTILRFAAGLEVLRDIVFPEDMSASLAFLTSLVRARPSLKELYFEDGSFIDDACVAVLCETLKLEKLQIDSNRSRLTPAVVDIILRSPTAETLSWACFSNTYAFTSGGILRLARNCPRLAQIIWRVQGLWPLVDGNGKNVDDLTALLRERCRGHSDWYFSVDPFRKFGPWKLSEVSWAYRDYPNHSEPQGFYAYNH